MQSQHEKIRFPCDLCDKAFTQKTRLKIHKSVVHEGNKPQYPCKICNATFTRKEYVKIHMLKICSKKEIKIDPLDFSGPP